MSEIWITGVGMVSPLGIGNEAVLESIRDKRSGVGPVTLFPVGDFPIQRAAEVKDFNARKVVEKKKALKISKRNIHLGLVAARLAWEEARLAGQLPADRMGVVMAAERITATLEEVCPAVHRSIDPEGQLDLSAYAKHSEDCMPPYWFLRHIPNMVPAHVAIELDLKGPSDTVCVSGVGGMLALGEAKAILDRGEADVMLAGGSSGFVEPYRFLTYHQKGWIDPNPESFGTSFSTNPSGVILGEGATLLVLETAESARKRGARPLAVWESFEAGRYVNPRVGEDAEILRKPSYAPTAKISALMGHGDKGLDSAEELLAGEGAFTCYRSLSGWLGATSGPHDLGCLLLEASRGNIDSPTLLQESSRIPERWISQNVGSGDRLAVQSVSRSGQYARLVVRLP
jgi:hypothetical protein